MPVKAIPDGYRSVTPYLCVTDAAAAIEFYKAALGATERMRLTMPGGGVAHAELVVGDSVVMLADEYPPMNFRGPQSFGGTPVMIHLYVDDVDAFVARAVAAGATPTRPLADQFYGDRTGGFADPYGHQWHVATHMEDVSEEEMGRRFAAMNQQRQSA